MIHYRNPAFCRGLGALLSAFYRALGKVPLSVTTAFAESKTFSTERHSAKTTMPSAKHLAKVDARQRAVSSRLYMMSVIFAEHQALALGKEATLPSVLRLTLDKVCFAECHSWTLGKIYFNFFLSPIKLFVVCCYTI